MLSVPARAAPAPALVGDLVQCPTPGCNTPLRPGKLAGHLLRCPVLAELRALESQSWYSLDVNTGAGELDESAAPMVMVSEEAASQLEARLGQRDNPLLHAPATHGAFMPSDVGVNERKRQRHRLQRDAIVRHVAQLEVLGRGRCIVELGAGNGELSLAIAEACPDAVRSDALILLDQSSKPKGRSGHGRHAADAALGDQFGSVARLKVGLEHVDLARLREEVAPKATGLVVLAKHLCGCASDYALRASVAASPRRSASQEPLALVLATCCHHRCTWPSFVNRRLLIQSGLAEGGFGAAEFDRLCRVTSRGVNAHDRSTRADHGRRAKDLLDEARADFMRSHGFSTRLTRFVDASVTPENVLLIATRD